MNKIFKIMATFVAAASVIGCTDTDDLEKRIDEIDARVTALEKVTEALNENVAALQAIAEGKTINKVEENSGTYTITLSDGTELKLNQGTEGMGKAPLLSIDDEGYWMADYQDGKGPQYILSASDEKVIGRGQNGVTPKFSVNAAGNWTVSYDGGKNWTEVLDENGKTVKAVAEGGESDSYFANVEYTDEALVLTLKNGMSYTAPVVGGFLFKISGAPEGDVTFKYGEKKTFGIEQKGVFSTSVICPEGWNAWLSESILTVQAPANAEATTKAVIADSRKDVSVIAISEAGHIAIAKVQVYLDGHTMVEDPAAGIKLVEAKSASLTFSVVLENASAWHYMLRKSSEAAPSRSEVITSGTEGTDNYSLTFESLMAETSYTLYVVPSNASGDGPLATCEASTTSFSNLYEAWEAGMDIKIGGVAYNKASYGAGTLISEGTVAVTTPGVYFIAPSAEVSLNQSVFKGSVMFIGNESGSRSSVHIISGCDYELGSESAEHHVVAFKNVSITNDNLNRRILSTASANIGRIVLENCYLGLNEDLIWRQKAGQNLNDMSIIDCDILVMNDKDSRGRALIQTWDGAAAKYTLGSFTAKNNVVWSDGEPRPFYFIDARYANGIEFAAVDIENNTLYNVAGVDVSSRRGLVTVNKISGDVTIKNNIAYQTNPVDKGTAGESKLLILSTKGEDREITSVNTGGNWSWYPHTTFMVGINKAFYWGSAEGTSLGMKLNGNAIDSINEPFESADAKTGTFVKKAAFADAGASR